MNFGSLGLLDLAGTLTTHGQIRFGGFLGPVLGGQVRSLARDSLLSAAGIAVVPCVIPSSFCYYMSVGTIKWESTCDFQVCC